MRARAKVSIRAVLLAAVAGLPVVTRADVPGLGDYPDRAAPLVPATPSDMTLDPAPEALAPPATSVTATAPDEAQPTTATASTQAADESKGEWLIAPLPNHMPEFGWGIIGRVGYIFPLDPKDKVSPPSIVAGFGYYSQNDSWAGGMATKLYLDQDRYRVTAALMHAELNYNFSGIGTEAGKTDEAIPLRQEMTGGFLECLFQVAPHFYLGPRYLGANVHIKLDTTGLNPPVTIPNDQINTIFSGLGVHAQWDTRDSQFYPRKGHVADVDVSIHDPALGDDFAYQIYEVSYNHYLSLATNQVLAFRAMGQFQNGDVPFYALSKFGRGADLRGYEIGQFQDKQMFAVQAEYRLEITKRIGAVAFAGVGEVMPSLSDINFDDLLPSGGVGLRYVLAEQNHVAIRLDGAWGREGGQFYLSVGEAF